MIRKLNLLRHESAALVQPLRADVPRLRDDFHRFNTVFAEPCKGTVHEHRSQTLPLPYITHADQANFAISSLSFARHVTGRLTITLNDQHRICIRAIAASFDPYRV